MWTESSLSTRCINAVYLEFHSPRETFRLMYLLIDVSFDCYSSFNILAIVVSLYISLVITPYLIQSTHCLEQGAYCEKCLLSDKLYAMLSDTV